MKEYESQRVLRIVGVVAGAMAFFLLVYAYFGSHFYFGSTVANVDVGGLSVVAAEKKIRQETKQVEIELKGENQTIKLQLASPYTLQKEYLKRNIRRGEVSLPLKKRAKGDLIDAINRVSFLGGKEAKRAKIVYANDRFKIEPEKKGTVIDSVKIRKELCKDIDEGTLQTEYALADFYREPEVTAKKLQKQKILQKLEEVQNRGIKLKMTNKSVPLTEQMLAASVDEQGNFDQDLILSWVAELEREHSTIYKSVDFTNVHGQHLRYKNIGNYGWFIDIKESAKKITKKLKEPETQIIQLVLRGETKKQPLHITKNYIEVDLDNQKMYCFNQGKKVVETDVITGRYDKGTATFPGFHTIMDKRRNVDLSGVLSTGDGTYNVPVDYWLPLLSYGQTITEIGLHDTDHKLQYFGQPGAYQTDLGSYGCVNTPKAQVAQIYDYSFIGMPVFIYGHIYDDAPGEFDKPVEYGTEI
ncbi:MULTISPECIES: L,D-transpeptidase [Enterococcus]|uniref:L,D-transpeptidase n=1 Tax=Enterococcus TaxID=1350 RepID=UPI0022E42531|nr:MULTISPECIES: L,D-transpeptidase [Enterococcus]